MNIKDCYVGQIVGITVNGDKYIGETVDLIKIEVWYEY